MFYIYIYSQPLLLPAKLLNTINYQLLIINAIKHRLATKSWFLFLARKLHMWRFWFSSTPPRLSYSAAVLDLETCCSVMCGMYCTVCVCVHAGHMAFQTIYEHLSPALWIQSRAVAAAVSLWFHSQCLKCLGVQTLSWRSNLSPKLSFTSLKTKNTLLVIIFYWSMWR